MIDYSIVHYVSELLNLQRFIDFPVSFFADFVIGQFP